MCRERRHAGMIRHLSIRNFKAIRSAEIDLGRFTVFVGPNSSGKTSILQALEHLAKAVGPADASHYLELTPSGSRHGGRLLHIEASGEWEGAPGRIHVQVELEDSEDEPYRAAGEWNHRTLFVRPDDRTREALSPRDEEILDAWRTTMLLRLNADALAEPSYAESEFPHMGSDGRGLASVLAQMALARPDDFQELTKALRAVIPQVERIRLSLAQIRRKEQEILHVEGSPVARTVERTYSGHRLLFDMVGAAGLPADQVSEGTLLVLGLLAVLWSPARPRLLLLDDLDRALHPRAQRDLVMQLRVLLDRFRDLQLLATSHSPYLVDHLKPEEIRLTTVSADGAVHCAPLKNHPRFEEWKDFMRPGEFWSTVGEDWVNSPEPERPGNA